jgi:hypothetical protein
MHIVVQIDGQLLFGFEVVIGVDHEVSVEGLCRLRIVREVKAQRADFSGTHMRFGLRATQFVARQLFWLEAEHREVLQIRAFAKHLARFVPSAIEQDEQRALVGVMGHVMDHACVICKLSREHHVGLPLRVSQKGK